VSWNPSPTKMKLHYPQKILEQLSEEQILKLKAGHILRKCQGCPTYFVVESKDCETKCPKCNLKIENFVKKTRREEQKAAAQGIGNRFFLPKS